MRITGLILQAVPNRGRLWTLEVFTEQLGRTSMSAVARPSTGFSPFCLIEAEIEQSSAFPYSRDVEILDTFSTIRSQPQASKAALLIRSILEQSLPMGAPAEATWKIIIPLLEALPSFRDWKAAPLLLALTLFEHEGINPHSLTELTTLTSESREKVRHLLNSDEKAWREAEIPEDVLKAALENINVIAKGGT